MGEDAMAAIRERTWTVEEYLELERTSEEKHEYLDGQIYAMGGASPNHNIIVANTTISLGGQTRKGACIVYSSGQRVKAGRDYVYPDITVACGTPQYADDTPRTLLNPTLIVEVLSPTTKDYDRRKKFQHYRELESLQEYLLIEQESHHIEHYVRQSDDQWLLTDHVGLDAVLELPSIGCTLALADVYEKVTFEEEEA
jgi:Uma2 family endonuclease